MTSSPDNPMVERVARAMCAAVNAAKPITWVKLHCEERELYETAARAAIAALTASSDNPQELIERLRAYSHGANLAHMDTTVIDQAADLLLAYSIEIEGRDAKIGSLFDAIAHGDDEHRDWLKEAIDAHFAGQPVPKPRGKGRKEAEIEGLRRRVGEAEAALDRVRAAVAFAEPRQRDELDTALARDIAAGLSLRKAATKHGTTLSVARRAVSRSALQKDVPDGCSETAHRL